jgi:hypothetical protein
MPNLSRECLVIVSQSRGEPPLLLSDKYELPIMASMAIPE